MKAEDKIRLDSASFDRESWAALWDRLPERLRKSTLQFVLERLHANESGGNWRMTWTYETGAKQEDSGAPIFEFTQFADVITFKGSMQVGPVGSLSPSTPLVSVVCLRITDWKTLKDTFPSIDLADDFQEVERLEKQQFVELVRDGKNPCRVQLFAAEFMAWCSTNRREPNASGRNDFAAEKLQAEIAIWRNAKTAPGES